MLPTESIITQLSEQELAYNLSAFLSLLTSNLTKPLLCHVGLSYDGVLCIGTSKRPDFKLFSKGDDLLSQIKELGLQDIQSFVEIVLSELEDENIIQFPSND